MGVRLGWAYLLLGAAEAALLLAGPFAVPAGRAAPSDLIYLLLLALHLGAGLLLLRGGRRPPSRLLRLPELLLAVGLLLFLFSWLYALNANMDYVQRFISGGGAVRLELDTSRERLHSAVRHVPLLLLDLAAFLLPRLRPWRAAPPRPGEPRARLQALSRWALPLAALSALLQALSFPSFLRLEGLPALAWVALAPLLLVLQTVPWRRGLLYGTFFGVLQGMLSHFWLGTFSLISLQVVSLFFFTVYLLFLAPTLWLVRSRPRLSFLIWPLAWVLFDWLRSRGFLGFPWGMPGTSQYSFTPLIQVASLTGVWGVTFLVVLVNASLAAAGRAALLGASAARRRTALAALGLSGGLVLAVLGGGLIVLAAGPAAPGGAGTVPSAPAAAGRVVRVALVQQNSDPRKDDYERTYDTLVRLTEEALRAHAGGGFDLVAWSETAFVPNIRRWSREDPAQYPLAALVRRFLAWQRELGTWLLTGNDDYELTRDERGAERRLDYNASVLFSPQGERVATYHKVHLVPFTEHFPFRESLPRVYELLKSFDVYLWEPGRERLVFRHPRFTFATPICFEDAFPDDIRRFVAGGAEVILNLSNDYWSLSEVEARQHYANSLFRAVENRRPLLRSTASGLTAHVDPQGRLRGSLPAYSEGWLAAEVPLAPPVTTFYTRHGDWFPQAAGSLLLALALLTALTARKAWGGGALVRAGRRDGRRPAAGAADGPGAADGCRAEEGSGAAGGPGAAGRRRAAGQRARRGRPPGRRSGKPAWARIEIAGDPGAVARLEGRWPPQRPWVITVYKN